MSKLHICYAIDDNYVQMCMLSIFNIILHRNPDIELDFLILGDNLINIEQFNKFKTIDKVSIKIKQLNAKAFIDKEDNWPNVYITGANRMRVIIPRLPEYKDVDRVLYLDADTLILTDLTEAFNIDLENKPIGICKNPVRITQGYRAMNTFGYYDRCHILNSGVILFNIKMCKNIDFTKQCVTKMRAEGNSNEHVISQIFYDQVKLLPPTYNCPFSMIIDPLPYSRNIDVWNIYYGTKYKSIKEIIQSSYILHFVGNIEETLTNIYLKQIYDEANKRLNKFLQTGIIDYQNIPTQKYYSSLII